MSRIVTPEEIDEMNGTGPRARQAAAQLDDERQLLGIAIARPEELAMVELPAAAFEDARNRAIYRALTDLHFSGDEITVGTISDALDGIERVYIARLVVDASATDPITYYAAKLQAAMRKRQAEAAVREMVAGLGRGDDPLDVLANGTTALAALDANTDKPRFPIISSAELAAGDYTIEYLIDGIIPRNQPVGWGGPAKGMKTSTALDAAISMATGGHFLGYWPAKQVEGVLFVSGESGLSALKDTARRQCEAARTNLADLDRLHWCTEIPQLNDADDLRALRTVLKRHKCDVMFLDPFYLSVGGAAADGAGSMFKMGPLLRSLSGMCAGIDVTPIVLHHTTRAAGKEIGAPLDLSAFAWSGFVEWMRAWVIVNRAEPYEDGSGLHRLNLVAGGSAGHSGCWHVNIDEGRRTDIGGRVWRVQVLKREEARQDVEQRREAIKERQEAERIERDVAKLAEVAERFPGGCVLRDLKHGSGMKPGHFDRALSVALERHVLTPFDVVRTNKQVYPGYVLSSLLPTVSHCDSTVVHSDQTSTVERDPIRVSPVHSGGGPINGHGRKHEGNGHSGTADDPIVFTGE